MVDYQSQFELNDSYYFTKLDFITWNRYFHVLQIFKKQKYNNILEIGSGDGILKSILKPYVNIYKTLDINIKMNPDFNHDLRFYNDDLSNNFDLIIITDVLEHIPFNDLTIAFDNLNKYLTLGGKVILTIPYRRSFISYFSSLNYEPKILSIKNGFLSLGSFYRNFIIKKPWIDPHHCYEIGILGIKVNDVEKVIKQNNFIILISKIIPYVNIWLIEKSNDT